jgi:hypothetical protein
VRELQDIGLAVRLAGSDGQRAVRAEAKHQASRRTAPS